MIVKHGDTYDVTWTLNLDLTGCSTRIIARRPGTDTPVVLAGTATDPTGGVITHTLTGTLPIGLHQVEVEVTTPTGDVVTFPTAQDGTRQYDELLVIADLG